MVEMVEDIVDEMVDFFGGKVVNTVVTPYSAVVGFDSGVEIIVDQDNYCVTFLRRWQDDLVQYDEFDHSEHFSVKELSAMICQAIVCEDMLQPGKRIVHKLVLV